MTCQKREAPPAGLLQAAENFRVGGFAVHGNGNCIFHASESARIDVNARRIGSGERFKILFREGPGDNDGTVDGMRHDAVAQRSITVVFTGMAEVQQEIIAAFTQETAEIARDFQLVRIGKSITGIGKESDQIRFAADKTPRIGVRDISPFIHFFKNQLFCRRLDRTFPVQRMRDRRCRYSQPFCEFPDVHVF